MAERMTYIGLLSNAVSYLVFRMHLTFPKASDLVTNVAGASNLTPLLGAFVADAYLGRFWTILVFGIIYLVVSGRNSAEIFKTCSTSLHSDFSLSSLTDSLL